MCTGVSWPGTGGVYGRRQYLLSSRLKLFANIQCACLVTTATASRQSRRGGSGTDRSNRRAADPAVIDAARRQHADRYQSTIASRTVRQPDRLAQPDRAADRRCTSPARPNPRPDDRDDPSYFWIIHRTQITSLSEVNAWKKITCATYCSPVRCILRRAEQ